jgi:hypothetical protein
MPDDFHRLVWTWLPLILTSDGTCIYTATYLRSRLFPLRDDITIARITEVFDWFVRRKMVLPYDVDGRRYLYVPTFSKYQGDTTREADSTIPKPTPEMLTTNSCNLHEQCVKDSCLDVDADADTNAEVDVDAAAQKAPPSPPQSKPVISVFQREAVHKYENTIGFISGATQSQEISDVLTALESRHIEPWWDSALHIAADQNKKSWAYVRAILRNCLADGKPPGSRPPGGNGHGPPKTNVENTLDIVNRLIAEEREHERT